MKQRCPCCDAERAKLDPIETFTLGFGLGDAGGERYVSSVLCTEHYAKFLGAMNSLRAKVDAPPEGDST